MHGVNSIRMTWVNHTTRHKSQTLYCFNPYPPFRFTIKVTIQPRQIAQHVLDTEKPTTEHHHDEQSCKHEHVGCCRHASSHKKGKSPQHNKDHHYTTSNSRDDCHKDSHHRARKSPHGDQSHRSKHCRQPGVINNTESEHPSSPGVHRHRASRSPEKQRKSSANTISQSKSCGDEGEREPIQYQRYHGNYWYGNIDNIDTEDSLDIKFLALT